MARTGFKKAKVPLKPAATNIAPQKSPSPPVAAPEATQSTGAEADLSSDGEDSGDDNDGVDEEGMKNLMRLLGEDGLDDVAEQQLSELGLDEEASGSDDEDEDQSASEEDVEPVVGDGSDGSDSGWVDEDDEMETPETSGARVVADEESEGSQEEEESDDDDEQGDNVPLDEVSDVDEDVVPKQKVVINNELALKRIRETIELGDDMPWTETLAFTASEPLEIPNADDDLNRELA
ncbi:rRNA-processing protein and EBNA1-binding protein ebp2, partial [Ceratobasidium sp. 395]